jgi:hypothetical protein
LEAPSVNVGVFYASPHSIRISHCDADVTHLVDVIANSGTDVFDFGSAKYIAL